MHVVVVRFVVEHVEAQVLVSVVGPHTWIDTPSSVKPPSGERLSSSARYAGLSAYVSRSDSGSSVAVLDPERDGTGRQDAVRLLLDRRLGRDAVDLSDHDALRSRIVSDHELRSWIRSSLVNTAGRYHRGGRPPPARATPARRPAPASGGGRRSGSWSRTSPCGPGRAGSRPRRAASAWAGTRPCRGTRWGTSAPWPRPRRTHGQPVCESTKRVGEVDRRTIDADRADRTRSASGHPTCPPASRPARRARRQRVVRVVVGVVEAAVEAVRVDLQADHPGLRRAPRRSAAHARHAHVAG